MNIEARTELVDHCRLYVAMLLLQWVILPWIPDDHARGREKAKELANALAGI